MQEFVDAMPSPADRFYTAAYLALPAADWTQARNADSRKMIDALSTGCFLMGVTSAIRTTLMQNHPATLSEAIQEAMSLELVEKTNGTKSKIASLPDMDDEDLVEIEDVDDVTIKAINMKRAKSGRQPFWQPSQFAVSKGKGCKSKSSGDRSATKCCFCQKEGHMQQECYSRINKNAPCVDRSGKLLSNSGSSSGRLASVEDDQDAELDTNLIRRMNGFIRSVQDQEDQDDLDSA